jgi:amidophosphoribosyltransferase
MSHSYSLLDPDKLPDKCGVLGMMSTTEVHPVLFQTAMEELQGRGEDASGVVGIGKRGKITVIKREGHIKELFDHQTHSLLSGKRSLAGHTRYTTSQTIDMENTQPFWGKKGKYEIFLSHNGNIPEKCIIRIKKKLLKRRVEGSSDSSVATDFLLQERPKYGSWEETFINTLPEFEGAFSFIIMTEEGKMYAIRDPRGIRPLSLGNKGVTNIVSSESVSFDSINAEYLRKVQPGEIRSFSPDGSMNSIIYGIHENREMMCLLEYLYIKKAKTFDGQETIEEQRKALGRAVARRFKEKGIKKADIVIPILNSGLYVSMGFAEEARIPIEQAALPLNPNRNKKKNRSFIQNTAEHRKTVVHDKHVVNRLEIKGKHIVLGDDSIIRGTSLEELIKRIWTEGKPKSIHVVIGAPPVIDTCDLGVAMSSVDELLAGKWAKLPLNEIEKRTAEKLNVDSVTFLPPKGLIEPLQKPLKHMCTHCFGGKHPIDELPKAVYRRDVNKKLLQQKVLFLASGNGTNVEAILQAMDRKDILAQPIGVVTNNPQAGIIARAERHNIPSLVFDSTGRMKGDERAKYFKELLKGILKNPAGVPDVIVLAGWMMILPTEFITGLKKKNIDIINLHPALLTGQGRSTVMTSKGPVPEIRGTDAIGKAFSKDLAEMPVTGVTVHHVVPAQGVDTGEVIIKQEVARRPHETLAELEERMHEVEHQLLPLAVQKILLHRLTASKKPA